MVLGLIAVRGFAATADLDLAAFLGLASLDWASLGWASLGLASFGLASTVGVAAVRDFAVVLGLAADLGFAAVRGLAAVRGFAAARVRVPVAAGAAEIVIAAPVSALAADDMALVAMFMACMALDIVLVAVFIACMAVDMVFADEVALVAAAAIWVADEATFTAAEDTVLVAAPVVRMLFAPVAAPRTGRAAVAFALVLGFRLLAAFLAALLRIALVRAVAADLRLTALRAWVCTGIDLPP